MPFFYDHTYFIYVLPFVLLAMYAQHKVSSNYNYYNQVANMSNLNGMQVARIILDRNNLQHVTINEVSGTLSDHYNPKNKTVNLSSAVYHNRSLSAASIAAHEVGHAIQHDKSYIPLTLRSYMAPLVQIANSFVWVAIMLGFLISAVFIDVGIILFMSVLAFQIITLPVEFDASRRAIKELNNGLIASDEKAGAKKVLTAAALTYIAATLVSVGELLRLLTITNRRNDRN